MTYFSPRNLSFIPGVWRDDGTYSPEKWPFDAVLLTEEEQATYWKQLPPEGKQLGAVDDRPAWVDLPPLSAAHVAGTERVWRDAELMAVVWLRDRHRDQLDIGIETTLTAEQFTGLLTYMQALRDWPQSEQFPVIEHRPVAPPWIAAQNQ